MLLHEIAKKQITEFAIELGFHSVGFAKAQDALRFPALCDWLDRGFSASMSYIERRREAYRNPQSVLQDCQTLIVLTLPYQGHGWTKLVTKTARRRELPVSLESTIGSYAAAREDYHPWIRRRLKPLVGELHRMFPSCKTRIVVDTAPLLERDFADQAGLGWIGKNTMLLNRQIGSYFFLCSILTQARLPEDTQSEDNAKHTNGVSSAATSHCGTCRACLDACPTDAFVEPYVLDANRCISYWTIEHRGAIPESFRPKIGPWLFGCDVCQIVCPWNRKAQAKVPEGMHPESVDEKSDCLHWLSLDQTRFDELYSDTPFSRTGLEGMQRNALIVAANMGLVVAVPWIERFTSHENHELRSLAHWALEQFL